ncbi:MAG: 30S ribosomal protein S12 methylthiotransferase RimO [Firmicutes bacterium]|nr:30S ribosomal protein S12 methylthiotransferase RimO [Bacillota bacterium]MDD6695723.1 30S ribosomal protein S12 methylthiotransferase RimO [Bacillota bacterium]MDY3771079.1 30S ribosomal protein S12 methylthiotransferase RimO [Lachnospiraceae bacterium]
MKIMFISLGCDKNLVDTEMMLGMLAEKGYQFTDDEQEAEIVVVNTCCFIGDAKEESINTLIEIGQLKETANVKMLIAAGCLAQRYRKEIREQIPEVDVIIGTMAIDKIVEAVEEYQTKQYTTFVEDIDRTPVSGKKRVVTTGGHYAYMKIAEGCDKRCSYCIIPKVRGSYRSIPMETLLKEANTLVEQGVKELILVAQETTLYGTDLYGKKSLPELLRKLSEIRGLYWIRILYCYPEEITEELIDTIAELPKVCHYLDIPIQHASDKILKRMGRRTNQQQLKDKIAMIRSKIPDMCLRTTLITGFPGESQEDHEQSMAFVDEMEFDRLGVFTYSAEEDTPAAGFPDQIEEELKKDRQADIMELQQEIAFEKAEGMTGQDVLVMIEGKVADENAYVGRTYKDAPNVDGLVFVNTDRELMTGDFVPVHITGSYEYDLIGEIKDENELTE